MYKVIAFLVTAVTFPGIATAVRADTSLSGKEIKQIIRGNTVVGERIKKAHNKGYISKGVTFKAYFKANGQPVDATSNLFQQEGDAANETGTKNLFHRRAKGIDELHHLLLIGGLY